MSMSNMPFALNQGDTGFVRITGIAYQASTGALLVADEEGPPRPAGRQPVQRQPEVDLALGQRGADNRAPNRDRDETYPELDCFSVQPDSFAAMGELRFDKLGTCT